MSTNEGGQEPGLVTALTLCWVRSSNITSGGEFFSPVILGKEKEKKKVN
jgi:hypothetical protein